MSAEHIEYETSTEEYWRISRWDALRERFSLEQSLLKRWHDAMAGYGRAWEILRLLYQIGPIRSSKEDLVYLDPRDEEDVSTYLGLSLEVIQSEVSGALDAWRNAEQESDLMRDLARTVEEGEMEQLTQFASPNSISADKVEELLKAYSFNLTDETERIRVAHRILDLKNFLIAPNTREIAREIIRVEISMRIQNGLMSALTNKLDVLLKEDPELRSRPGDADSLNEKIRACDLQLGKLARDHGTLLKNIGADDLDLSAKKRIFIETTNHLMERCREFEADPDNKPVDGVFTAREIEWLTEPMGERGSQYRPDIVIRVREALVPENLWNPLYKPTEIDEKALARLRRISDAFTEEMMSVDGEDLVEEDDADTDVEDDESGGPAVLPVSSVEMGDEPSAGSILPQKKAAAFVGFFNGDE